MTEDDDDQKRARNDRWRKIIDRARNRPAKPADDAAQAANKDKRPGDRSIRELIEEETLPDKHEKP